MIKNFNNMMIQNQQPNTPSHVYIDIALYNTPSANSAQGQPLIYVEQRQNAILPSSSNEWYMSVVRFSLQTSGTLPIWIPEIELGTPFGNILVYKLTLQYKSPDGLTTYELTENINWFPEDLTEPMPSKFNQPVYTQQTFTPFYYAYSSQHIINLFNATLAVLYTNMKNLVGANFVYTLPSFFELDQNNRWVLNSPAQLFDYNNVANQQLQANKCFLFMNTPTYILLSSFPAYHCDTQGYKNYRFNIYNNNNGNILNIPAALNLNNNVLMLQLFQEYDSSSLFCPIQSLVFKTVMIPISNTLSSPPTVFGNPFLNAGNNSQQDNILTDFEIDMENIASYNGTLQYTPQSEYRLIDLVGAGDTPFNQIDISAFWKDDRGILHQIILDSGCNFNMKIMFRKKSFNNQ